MKTADLECKRYQGLVDRLASHGVDYLDGGSQSSPTAAALSPLLTDLAAGPTSRLQSALVALLLRHPEYASVAEANARERPVTDPVRRRLLLSVLIAASLQSEWGFSLDLYLPHRTIDAEHLAAQLGLPSPRSGFGEPCLTALNDLQRGESLFPVNHRADWENAAHRLIAQLVREARSNDA